jgi:outer membrane protein assembly factor BamA
LDAQQTLGALYYFDGLDALRFFFSRRDVNQLTNSRISDVGSALKQSDVEVLSYGLGLRLVRLDNRINPRKGLRVQVNASIGSKSWSPPSSINDSLRSLIPGKSTQWSGDAWLEWYVPLFKRFTFLLGGRAAMLQGGAVQPSEALRFGGLQTLRGFDDESLRATAFGIGTAELRFLLDKNSNIMFFYNRAYYQRLVVEDRAFDRPFGFGAGITFETKAGLFALTYALGKQLDNPLLLRAAKVHFGIISTF